MPLVTDTGFAAPAPRSFIAAADLAETDGDALSIDLPNDGDVAALASAFDRIALIRIPFPSYADGRGFSLARRVREAGFSGVLRAHGNLLPDQKGMVQVAGFDEIELDDASAARQTPESWAQATALPSYRRKIARRNSVEAVNEPRSGGSLREGL